MLKVSIQLEEITLMYVYTNNVGAPKYIMQILTDLKGEIGSNRIIVGDFNTHFYKWMDHLDSRVKMHPNRHL